MMRWIFAALVLANVGLLMWASWFREAPGERIVARPLYHPELMVPLKAGSSSLRARKSERAEAPLAEAKPRPRCVTLGPLSDAAADKAAAWLAGEQVSATRRDETQKTESGHWVFLAPFATRKEAEAQRRELDRVGLREHLIMKDSEGRIAISLGLYTSAENARNRLKELTEKGVTAQLETRYKSEKVHYFDLRLAEPADETLSRLRAQGWAGSGAEVRDTPCAPENDG